MKKTVFLNSEKIDFDHHLDFASLEEITLVTKHAQSSSQEILARVQGQNIIVTKEMPLGRDLISEFAPSVELICEAGTGYNNIDLAAAKEKNIAVCNVPGYSTEAVAQLVIAFLTGLSSSLALQKLMIERNNFSNFTQYLQVPHFELKGKTLGVIGAGAIAKQVIKAAVALEMNIAVYSRSVKDLGSDAIKFVSLEELFKISDFLTVHCPLTADTKHLINLERIKLMKPSAFIINTSRGSIIKEDDLIKALEQKIIAGAALDVQDPEPPAITNPLFKMDNVILTPHIGWQCLETRQRLLEGVANNIKGFVGGSPVNIVG